MSQNTSLAPGLLIASPRLDGSLFERAVVVMVHHDDEGAMGFIVNKPLEMDLQKLFESVEDGVIPGLSAQHATAEVRFGGPVRWEQLWILLRQGEEPAPICEEDAIHFSEGWRVIATADDIEQITHSSGAFTFIPCLGYSGWDAGQLEAEIEDGSWLFLDFDESLALDDDADTCWERALTKLGVNPMAFLFMPPSSLA